MEMSALRNKMFLSEIQCSHKLRKSLSVTTFKYLWIKLGTLAAAFFPKGALLGHFFYNLLYLIACEQRRNTFCWRSFYLYRHGRNYWASYTEKERIFCWKYIQVCNPFPYGKGLQGLQVHIQLLSRGNNFWQLWWRCNGIYQRRIICILGRCKKTRNKKRLQPPLKG